MEKIFLSLGASLAGLAVLGGALATHALSKVLSVSALQTWETGIKFQMYHALALMIVGILLQKPEIPVKGLLIAGYTFLGGILLFSGSLYALSLSGVKTLGVITPFGGLFLITAWVCLSVTVWRSSPKH